ncbi:O-antigen ligase family protein [Aureibaculum luteum]|uniref:O-antigen ligase family protein n=1 Tax=Aureibaculum luteum TaxID=1548456 RepID=UPI0013002C0F|nr:O-antigen ligase family protein [Aureibaculum luteum]
MDFNSTLTVLTYIGVFLILIYGNKSNPIKFPTYLLFYLLFILYVYHSAFYQLNREFKIAYLYKNALIGAFNLLFIIENLSINKKYFEYLFKISKKIIILAVITILIQQAYSANFFLREDMVDENTSGTSNVERLHSIYSWVGSLTNGLGFVPIFLLVVEDLNKRKHSKRVLLWILLGVVYSLLTKSRWIMVNTLMVFIVVLITHHDKFNEFLKYLFVIPFILIISYFTLNAIGVNAEGIVNERVLEKGKSKVSEKSAGTRLLAIQVFNKLYWKNAVFGKGDIKYGMGGTGRQDYELRNALARKSSQLHVGYLSLFYMYGFVGGILFLSFLFFFLRKMYRNAKNTAHWAPFIAILGFAVANLTLVTFSLLELGLLFAVLADKYFVEQKKSNLMLKKVKKHV